MTTTTDMPPTIMNAKQTAQFLQIGERTLWSLTKGKQIPHFRVGSAYRYALRDIEAWIEKRKREALR